MNYFLKYKLNALDSSKVCGSHRGCLKAKELTASRIAGGFPVLRTRGINCSLKFEFPGSINIAFNIIHTI